MTQNEPFASKRLTFIRKKKRYIRKKRKDMAEFMFSAI